MFCGAAPCECDGSPKPKKRQSKTTRTPSVSKESTTTSPSVMPVPDMEDVFGEVPTASQPFRNKTQQTDDRDLSYLSALRILRPLVNDVGQRLIDKELNPPYPQEIDRRVSDWRKRHGTLSEGAEIRER